MATRKVLLQEDRTGLSADNLIQGEQHDIGIGRNRLLIPQYGAFYTEGVVIKDSSDNIIDRSLYLFSDIYKEATLNSGKEVWNAIIITDMSIDQNLKIDYQAYGGKFSANVQILLDWVNEKLSQTVDPIEWLNLIDVPREFPVAAHQHLWSEVFGWDYIKPSLVRLENAISLDKSALFKIFIDQIKYKIDQTEQIAKNLAEFYAINATSSATNSITKQTLDIHLLANLPLATEYEASQVSSATFDSSSVLQDKYINKRGLVAFTKGLKARSVSIAETGLGTTGARLGDSTKGSILSLSNGAIVTFESKQDIVSGGNGYEENVYPKNYPDTDRFTIVRVTNNLGDHGGIFLGFNNTTGQMYSGVLKDDYCFRRIEWYKFYSEDTYDSILDNLNNHIALKNNPHELDKVQVKLEKVANFPVATLDQIMSDKPQDTYITLDTLQAFMTKHMLDLKPELNEDGSLNKDSDTFAQPNVIYTPCDKPPVDNWPPAGQVLKTYCDGSDRFQRVADGKGGFTDQILQLDSDDCKYFDIQPQGTKLYDYCKGQDRYSVIADGRGGSTEVLTKVADIDCGFVTYPPAGTVLSEQCQSGSYNYVRTTADGTGGSIQTVLEINSSKCGFTTTTTTTAAPITTTTQPPAVKRLLFYTNTPSLEPGTVETLTLYAAGYTPFSVVNIVYYARMDRWPAELQNSTDYPTWQQFTNTNGQVMITDVVNIGSNGVGTWSFTHTNGIGAIPIGTVWSNWAVDDFGTKSNIMIRGFNNSGEGTSPPNTIPAPPSS